MATFHEPPETTGTHGHDHAVELLPLADESPAMYLARLKSLHRRVGALIDAIEQRKPVLGPPPGAAERPERTGMERRITGSDRREGLDDRRIGLPEARSLPAERRFGARERRAMPVDRREEQIERRRDPDWPSSGFKLDGTALMWALQIAAWIAVAAIALIYGIGG